MVRLHRHQLAHLAPAAWRALKAQARDDIERECLTLWAARALPLVVTQQRCSGDEAAQAWISMGLSAPLRWGRRRIALRVARTDVLYFDEFPAAPHLTAALPARSRPDWERLCAALQACGVTARVFGSHGWELLSGMAHVRPGSDSDLWIGVSDPGEADRAVASLQRFTSEGPRLDGELLFNGDTAVSWREWAEWRAGHVRSALVKTMQGVRMVRTVDELSGADLLEAAT
ncbi:MAG: malonate decarboxylase holo-[acyl-carrier-protein] synthase [Burkholderiaceae bacterium]